MSDMVKLAKVIDELHDVGQPTGECQLIWNSRRKLATWIESLFVQGGAKGTEKRVLAMMAWPSRKRLLHGDVSLFVQGGAEGDGAQHRWTADLNCVNHKAFP